MEKNLFGNIIYNMLGLEAYLQYFNKSDSTVNKGIEILEKGEAFPKAPVITEEPETQNKNERKEKKTAKVDSKYLFCNFSLKNSFKTLRFYHWRLVPHG